MIYVADTSLVANLVVVDHCSQLNGPYSFFFLLWFKDIGQGFNTKRCQLGKYRDEGDRSRGGGIGTGGQRGLNREEEPSD